MSQISAGTANVTNGNNIVQLPGADLSGVMSGHAFHVRGVDAVYSIIAAAPAASPPTVTLSVNYAGITASGVEYRITTGFSPNNSLYEPDPGDVDIPMLLKHRLIRPLDGAVNFSRVVYWDVDTQSVNGVQRIRHGFDNFLGNSNFEHWLDGVNAAPSAWTVQGDVTVSRSSTATAGAYSAQLVFGTGNTGELYQVIPTNTVVDYTFSCYVQRTAGTGRARLVAQQADAPYTEFASVELSTVAGWQPAMLTVKPSAGSLLRFAIKSYDNVASTWLIDECMFEESKGVASTWTAAALNDSSDQNVWGVQYFKQRPELQWGAIIRNLPVYADNTAAIAGGLTTDTVYRTATGVVMVVY